MQFSMVRVRKMNKCFVAVDKGGVLKHDMMYDIVLSSQQSFPGSIFPPNSPECSFSFSHSTQYISTEQ